MTAAEPAASHDAATAGPSILRAEPRPERQLTRNRGGHILTNTGVWSPDGAWIVYDTRSDPEGAVFDGTTIEVVNVQTLETRVLYRSMRGACCGVATFNPVRPEVIFIHGPEDPTPEWNYTAFHRRGVVVRLDQPQIAVNLDARDMRPPFTAGALRGGSHVHVFSGDGEWVSFTYEDHVLARFTEPRSDHDLNQRNIGVSCPIRAVRVNPDHPRNHDGSHFTVLATRTVAAPKPGDIIRACEEGWVGTNGYRRDDGRRQQRALAFQGHVLTAHGDVVVEVFIVDLPEDLTVPGDGPLGGTETRMPFPPRGTLQRRLTNTEHRKFPGLQGPRHWLRCSPDGEQIAFLMKDDGGIVQLWTVSPRGGDPVQRTRNPWNIASTFTWSPDSRRIAHVMDNSVFVTDVATGVGTRLTARVEDADAPRPEACVFSPDGRQIAYVRQVPDGDGRFNQIFVVSLEQVEPLKVSMNQPEIVRRDGFLVMGTVTRRKPGADSPETVASIWTSFEKHHESIQCHSVDSKYYGVSFAAGLDGSFDYMAGMAVRPVAKISEGLEVRQVPAATYAVFDCPVLSIGQTYRYIFGGWRAESGFEIDVTKTAFEEYPADTNAPVRIHIPIVDRTL